MPRIRDPNRDKAFQIYKKHSGKIDLVEIANQLSVPPGTVRGWKAKDKWEQQLNGTFQKNTERSIQTKKRVSKQEILQEILPEVTQLDDSELTNKQNLFCLYYVKSFNATQSYLKAYGCSYNTAMVEGSSHLRNPKIKAEIDRLKEIKRQQIAAGEEDLVEFHMRIAFADMGDYVSFGREEVPIIGSFGPLKDEEGNMLTEEVNAIRLKESTMVDTQLIKEVKQGKDGIGIKLIDRCKSLEWLDKHFLMNPMDKHKVEYDQRKLALAEAKAGTGEEVEIEDDGFMNALKGKVEDIWEE